jgi:phytoene synthase
MSVLLYDQVSFSCSRSVTKAYSTSFSLASALLGKEIRQHIYNIYGFVRLADEIVDSFHAFNKPQLLSSFREETFRAIDEEISLNPILNSFQRTVNAYNMDVSLIEAFFESMEMDLHDVHYDEELLKKYIYGSAEVVGLMCLTVFVDGDRTKYDHLSEPARALGSAFQKINFLRDFRQDLSMSRQYFQSGITDTEKLLIQKGIDQDLVLARSGILALPATCRLGVMVAFRYYNKLYEKIKRCDVAYLTSTRVRIPDAIKIMLLISTYVSMPMNSSLEKDDKF